MVFISILHHLQNGVFANSNKLVYVPDALIAIFEYEKSSLNSLKPFDDEVINTYAWNVSIRSVCYSISPIHSIEE